MDKIINSDTAAPEVRVCSTALRFMLQVLNWDFRCSINGGIGVNNSINVSSFSDRQDGNSAYILVKPGPSWRDVLLSSSHRGWLLSFYGALREKFSGIDSWMDWPIAVYARKLIVQFCSLAGTLFPPDAGYSEGQHLQQLLSGIIQWLDPPDVIAKAIEHGKSESEMLDGCHGLLSIAAVSNPVRFDQLLKPLRPFGTISLLSSLTCEVVKDLMTKHVEDEPWSWVAHDILLDTWTVLLTEKDNTGENLLLPPEGVNAAANLFSVIVNSDLKAASDSEEKKDYYQTSVAAMDKRLRSFALVAQAAIDVTIPLLTGLFSERFAWLHQGRDINDQTKILEELYSLMLITGHVLADEGEGETTLVPKAIQTHFTEYVEAEKHPVVLLSGTILKFVKQILDPDMRAAFFSPRLMEAIIWFLARWSSTYLMAPHEGQLRNRESQDDMFEHQHSNDALLGFFGESTYGKAVLNIIVRVSSTTLISYPGEKDLQALTCYQLLHGVVRRTHICTHLVSMDSWRELAYHFANERGLFSLNTAHQRSLAQIFVLSASGMRSSEEANLYVRDLTNHMTSHLTDISSKSHLKSISQQPDVILMVTCLLERLRGASSASKPQTQKAVYQMGYSVMESVRKFLEVCKHESAVVYRLLRFVVDWVEGQIIFLQHHETPVVADFCMHLLQIYYSHNIGKISASVSSSLLSEENTEKYRNLRALLQLLLKLCTKDMVDLSSAHDEDQLASISQVIYVGVHIVSPLITFDMLKYPKLCHDHFALLSHMLEVYPEMVPKLNLEAFEHVSGSLVFGLHHQDAEIVLMCLRALRSLGFYHYKEKDGGRNGLGPHAACYKDDSGNLHDGILSRFLRSLLQLILFEDYSTDLVGAAADALYPLILCDNGLYLRLGEELIERQPNPVCKARMAKALHSLTSSNNLSPEVNRSNLTIFRKNLRSFLIDARGFLLIV